MIPAALGREIADDFFYNLVLFNPFTCAFEPASFAVSRGVVVGLGRYSARREHDLGGARVVPGLVDAHVHVESSLLVPTEYARLAARCGTTTVVADPHEIANVCGVEGIEYMLAEAARAVIDILIMLPSCVPATD
ncbi:MAG: adenine deaminase, partial [Methanobacteriota archaeon]